MLFVASFCSTKTPDWHNYFGKIRVILSHWKVCNIILHTFKHVFSFSLSLHFCVMILISLQYFLSSFTKFCSNCNSIFMSKNFRKRVSIDFHFNRAKFCWYDWFWCLPSNLIILHLFAKLMLHLVFCEI